MNVYYEAAIWIAMALVSALVALRLSAPVALAEIVVGALAANIPGVKEHVSHVAFVAFLAAGGSLLLTFLAGAEIDPVALRRSWRKSLLVGLATFAVPFATTFVICHDVLGWHLRAAELGAIALSTTSVAVIYAVLIETRLTRTELGTLLLAGCFFSNLATVLALGGFFAAFGWRLALLAGLSVLAVVVLPRLLRRVLERGGERLSEPEVKFLLVVLFALGGLAVAAGTVAVLPAYLVGLAVAGPFVASRALLDRVRSVAFALFTPFFFLEAGTLVSAHVLVTSAGAIGLLLVVKLGSKMLGTWPAITAAGVRGRARTYTTLLFASGLTFGLIAALFGREHHVVSATQYTVLTAVIVLSAILPTALAQQLFRPAMVDEDEERALGAQDLVTFRRPPVVEDDTSP
jgi:Kef-type K+ transport system membrane component KefB